MNVGDMCPRQSPQFCRKVGVVEFGLDQLGWQKQLVIFDDLRCWELQTDPLNCRVCDCETAATTVVPISAPRGPRCCYSCCCCSTASPHPASAPTRSFPTFHWPAGLQPSTLRIPAHPALSSLAYLRDKFSAWKISETTFLEVFGRL